MHSAACLGQARHKGPRQDDGGTAANHCGPPPRELGKRHIRTDPAGYARAVSYALRIETLTFLFTDIEESTALLQRVGVDLYASILAAHHKLIRDSLERHQGSEQGTHGDSFFAVFTSPGACVAAAVEMQRALASHEWPHEQRPRVRMGIHTGEASKASTGLVGLEVHRAARIAGVGHGGQILLSSAAASLVRDSSSLEVRDLGAHRLKDLGRPEVLFQLMADGLRSEFPPLRSLDNPELPNNLPASLSQFVGRRAEIGEVRALILERRLVTLTGAGGSGKTRLALQAAAELLDGTGEGVWLVEMAPIIDPDQVPQAVISALGLLQDGDRLHAICCCTCCANQNVLVILDNCEHVIDAVAQLADLIGRSCPKVRLVATSREPLGVDGEHVYRVRSLSLPSEAADRIEDLEGSDAVELFVVRARAHDSSFLLEDSVVPLLASVCRRLDGIPLAIELAASRLSSMSLEDLHRRLDQRFRLLTGGSRGALPRQQTLGAMVAWSYDLLTESEREVLRRLSVFVGSFDLRAAEALCAVGDLESSDVADLLSSLVNKSLVAGERASTSLRYRLLETIRQYAADQLAQVGGDAEVLGVRLMHADYYLGLCEEVAPALTGPQQGVWLKRLDLEWDNLQAALHTLASDQGRTEQVLRFGVAITHFVFSRQHQTPIVVLSRALLRDVAVPTLLRAWALLATATMTGITSMRPYERASDLCEEAVELAHELGEPALEAEARVQLTFILRDLERWEAALEHAREALVIARRISDPRLVGQALFAVGWAQPRPELGHEFYLEALLNLRLAGDLLWVCNALLLLAIGDWINLDQVRQGRALAEEAMELAGELGSTFHVRLLSANDAIYCYLLGEFEAAERYGRRSLLWRGVRAVRWKRASGTTSSSLAAQRAKGTSCARRSWPGLTRLSMHAWRSPLAVTGPLSRSSSATATALGS